MDRMDIEDGSRRPSTQMSQLGRIVAPGIVVLKRLWLPFLLIQLIGLAVVVLYFAESGFRAVCDAIGQIKVANDPWFAMLVMPVASGIVPELFKTITGIERRWDGKRLKHTLYAMGVFSLAGLYVDSFYRVMNHTLGDAPTTGNVVTKVAIDQLVYTTIVGVPWMALAFNFEAVGFSLPRLWRSLRSNWYMCEVAPMLVVCWAYWFPMTTLMYMLPASLTFVFGATASAASATLLVAVARRHQDTPLP